MRSWSLNPSPAGPAALALGRSFFGLATIASGVLQLVTGDFVRIVPALPSWVPAPSAWARLAGVVLVVAGFAMVSGRRARTAASVVGTLLLAKLVLLNAPQMVWNPLIDRPLLRGFMWTNPFKSLALVGGVLLLAAWSPGEARRLSALARGFAKRWRLGALLLAAFLLVCGLQHFAYRDFVTDMVPAWLPGRRSWTYFTGLALIAGGTGMLVRRTARLAAGLSALMVFLWVPMLHIPRALAGPRHADETAGVFEALAISGVALLVAGTRVARPDDDATREG
jgi:uncharacterized membrane protein